MHEAASKRTKELLRRLAVKQSKPEPTLQAGRSRALALFFFDKDKDGSEGDLPFEKGDILEVELPPLLNEGWWTASLKGKRGLIPSNYVRILKDDEVTDLQATSSTEEDGVETGLGHPDKKTSRFDEWKARFDRMRKASMTRRTS